MESKGERQPVALSSDQTSKKFDDDFSLNLQTFDSAAKHLRFCFWNGIQSSMITMDFLSQSSDSEIISFHLRRTRAERGKERPMRGDLLFNKSLGCRKRKESNKFHC